MALNIPGLVSLSVFFMLTLAIGIWASWKSKKDQQNRNPTEMAIVGGRNINVFIGLFTATATWVGGAYINGTAEIVYLPSKGLLWVQAPVGFALSLVIGGCFFVNPMRSKNYVTVMDPLQETYGNVMGSLLFIPPLLGEVFWFAAILASLGATMRVILNISGSLAIIVSACTVILYTLLGGLYSVAYTDVIQLVFITLSLWVCIPFALTNSATESIYYTANSSVRQDPWIGKIEKQYLGRWLDDFFYLVLGSIPWQTYFQRVLSSASPGQARLISYLSGLGCFSMAIPSVIIGAVAASTDWNQTSYGLPSPFEKGESAMVLPLVLRYLCPAYISIVGLGAITAAGMSSADSALLSASSMFAHNIYRKILRKEATDTEVLWAMRISMLVSGAGASGLAFYSSSVYDLWFLSGELVYALLFPQLCCALFAPSTNTYGSAAGFLVGLLLRLLAGEPALSIPPIICYPACCLVNGTYSQLFPFKTFIMLLTLGTIVAVSYLAQSLFQKNLLPRRWDVCNIMGGTSTLIPLQQMEKQMDSPVFAPEENLA
ncbi:LOW QUALITY PROTEIN: high affinity choline transporter 1-like [Melopsittacus undulatus]|uniref:LOW QUALITY PROTEIN: high affinity choline transporter 1-like n=1 Tax=Melopsittacus undulatus TaxID=13146 RepID=UPI00146DBAA0|nr:LOW QUALITY PROTEIN: high affinity choline transporter 1-like [Melopsittacus undulatus]